MQSSAGSVISTSLRQNEVGPHENSPARPPSTSDGMENPACCIQQVLACNFCASGRLESSRGSIKLQFQLNTLSRKFFKSFTMRSSAFPARYNTHVLRQNIALFENKQRICFFIATHCGNSYTFEFRLLFRIKCFPHCIIFYTRYQTGLS